MRSIVRAVALILAAIILPTGSLADTPNRTPAPTAPPVKKEPGAVTNPNSPAAETINVAPQVALGPRWCPAISHAQCLEKLLSGSTVLTITWVCEFGCGLTPKRYAVFKTPGAGLYVRKPGWGNDVLITAGNLQVNNQSPSASLMIPYHRHDCFVVRVFAASVTPNAPQSPSSPPVCANWSSITTTTRVSPSLQGTGSGVTVPSCPATVSTVGLPVSPSTVGVEILPAPICPQGTAIAFEYMTFSFPVPTGNGVLSAVLSPSGDLHCVATVSLMTGDPNYVPKYPNEPSHYGPAQTWPVHGTAKITVLQNSQLFDPSNAGTVFVPMPFRFEPPKNATQPCLSKVEPPTMTVVTISARVVYSPL